MGKKNKAKKALKMKDHRKKTKGEKRKKEVYAEASVAISSLTAVEDTISSISTANVISDYITQDDSPTQMPDNDTDFGGFGGGDGGGAGASASYDSPSDSPSCDNDNFDVGSPD